MERRKETVSGIVPFELVAYENIKGLFQGIKNAQPDSHRWLHLPGLSTREHFEELCMLEKMRAGSVASLPQDSLWNRSVGMTDRGFYSSISHDDAIVTVLYKRTRPARTEEVIELTQREGSSSLRATVTFYKNIHTIKVKRYTNNKLSDTVKATFRRNGEFQRKKPKHPHGTHGRR